MDKKIWLVLSLILIAPSVLMADTETEEKVKELVVPAKQGLRNLLSGVTSNIDGFSSVIENFLPDFQLSSLLLGDEQAKNPIVADVGFLLFHNNPRLENNAKLQLKINTDAKVSEDLAKAFASDQLAAFGRQLDSFDDTELTFSYNVVNTYFGRDLEPHRLMFSRLASDIFGSQKVKDAEQQRNLAQIDLVNHVALVIANQVLDCEALKVEKSFSAQEMTACLNFNASTKVIKAAEAEYNQLNPQHIAGLVASQPQLQFSGSVINRDDIVGQDEFSIKVSYEMGTANMNALYRKLRGAQSFSSVYKDFAQNYDPRRQDGRFKFSIEYSDVDDQRFIFENTSFLKKGGEKIKASASYGRSIMFDAKGDPVMRADASIEAEEFLNDTEGNDRYIGTLTITRKISNNLSIPLSIQYANKSEFLSDDSKEVFANIGFKYDFDYKK